MYVHSTTHLYTNAHAGTFTLTLHNPLPRIHTPKLTQTLTHIHTHRHTHFLTRTHYTYSRIISSLLLTLSKHPSPTNISHSAFSPYPLLFQLLSAQHLSNCAFGLQGLSSTEPEVRALVHALVPKILACRDELSMEQIGHALFGLQNLSSDHEEVNRQQHKICLCVFSRV